MLDVALVKMDRPAGRPGRAKHILWSVGGGVGVSSDGWEWESWHLVLALFPTIMRL